VVLAVRTAHRDAKWVPTAVQEGEEGPINMLTSALATDGAHTWRCGL
jgi:hypothetical protein